MTIEVIQDPSKDPIRRLTNLELWQILLNGLSTECFPISEVEQELEWRLRKIAFLPALPPKADDGEKGDSGEQHSR